MSEIIETMARADVDYFWQEGGNRFENFEKTVAAGVQTRMEAIVAALAAAGFEIRNAAQTGLIPGSDVYESRLLEIGRITTTWAKFEHFIDQAIWILAKVGPREGACITSQIGSVAGKFRALVALMAEAQRPEEAQKAVRRMNEEASAVALIRNKFAHGPLDMGVNFDTRDFEVYLRRITIDGKKLVFETSALTHEELVEAQRRVSALYQILIENWPSIVGKSSLDPLAPAHS
jgi:hypothetical protein